MRRTIWAGFLLAIISFVVWSKDPLNDIVNFIIAGSIPGTNLAIGLWSSLLIALVILLVIWRGIRRTRFQLLASTAEQIKAETIQTEFAEKNSSQFDKKHRSVIAAPSTDLVV